MPGYAATGGPDSFGYTWASGVDGPAYSYEFSNVTGLLPIFGDDDVRQVTLPFVFEFYGQPFQTIRVHSNGGITFGGGDAIDATHTCPVTAADDLSLYAYWMDLDPSEADPFSGEGIYFDTKGSEPNRHVVIEWFDVQRFETGGGNSTVTFEIKLFEADHHIEIHYQDLDFDGSAFDDGAASVIGLASADGALIYSCDTASVSGGQAIGFYPPPCDDLDGDGSCAADDCDNGNADVHPGAIEVCDGLDNDCSGAPGDGEVDDDGDGWMVCENDCDDGDSAVYPADLDGDGWSPCLGDCDDTDPDVNDIDNDGDGLSGCAGDCDDTEPGINMSDADGDGRTSCADDCDDAQDTVFGGAPELCDGLDNDCDGDVDENPNCGDDDDDDDDVVADDAIAYGCFLQCTQSGASASPIWGWLALCGLGVLCWVRRERGDVGA